jgi:hypothetical protein
MDWHRAATALTLFLQACGGDVRQISADPEIDDAGNADAAQILDAGETAPDARSADAAPDPCAPENRPVCGVVRERVVRNDSGQCVLYVLHAAADPRPFDPNVVGLQIATAAGPRRLTYVSDASACSTESPAGVLAWYFVANPPHLVFCPLACEAFQREGDVVELLLGCGSICPPP